MSAHTPGPWELGDENNAGAEVSLGPELTASLNRCSRFGSDYIISREELLANARLIAAAPDLLAVCERYVDSQDPCIRGDTDRATCECVACGTTRDARAAIAKAVGK